MGIQTNSFQNTKTQRSRIIAKSGALDGILFALRLRDLEFESRWIDKMRKNLRLNFYRGLEKLPLLINQSFVQDARQTVPNRFPLTILTLHMEKERI